MEQTIYKSTVFRITDSIDTVNTPHIEVRIDESPYSHAEERMIFPIWRLYAADVTDKRKTKPLNNF